MRTSHICFLKQVFILKSYELSLYTSLYTAAFPFCQCLLWSKHARLQTSARGIGVGGGGWGGGGVTSHIWHSTDVRAEWPPFSAAKYMISPLFSAKSI